MLSDRHIEQELHNKALRHFPWAHASVIGRDVTLTGTAPTTKDRADLLMAVSATPGVGSVDDSQLGALPHVKPYFWSIDREVDVVSVTGFAPSDEVRSGAMNAIRLAFPGSKVIDKMVLVSGQPPEFPRMITLAASALAKLKSGSIVIEDANISLSGVAADEASSNSAINVLKNRPTGYVVVRTSIDAPKSMTPQSPTPQSPPPQSPPQPQSPQPQPPPPPQASLPPKQSVQTEPPRDASPTPLAPAVEIRPDHPRTTASIPSASPPTAPTAPAAEVTTATVPSRSHLAELCQQSFSTEVTKAPITFSGATSTLEPASYAVLNRLVEIARKCPDAKIEIGAHTDSYGEPSFNNNLSQQRAKAVLDYFRARISVANYTAVGYGSAKPIAPNNTTVGAKKNRRVEFSVR